MRLSIALVLGILAAGCGDDGAPPALDQSTESAADLSMAASMDFSTAIDRGPTDLRLTFEPSGLYWDSPTQALYISTGSNQIMRWTDAGGLELVATLGFSLSPQSNNLGQLVRLSDGRIVVTVRGAGTNGNVVAVHTDGTAAAVPGLDQKRQRVGLALAADGTLYDGWFAATGTMTPRGGVSRLDLTSGESDLLLGLQQPFGVEVTNTQLLVADQKQNAIFAMPLGNTDVDGGSTMKLATLSAPDLTTLGPGGDLFAGGPVVARIKPDGTVSTFATETRNVRGVAYDSDHQRLFVGDPDAKYDADAGSTAVLHILPVN